MRFEDQERSAAPQHSVGQRAASSSSGGSGGAALPQQLAELSLGEFAAASGGGAGLSSHPVFVLDVEDASGPLEGSTGGLDLQYGRIRVADGSQLGISIPSPASPQEVGELRDTAPQWEPSPTSVTPTLSAAAAEPGAAAAGGDDGSGAGAFDVGKAFTARMRQGIAKFYPSLAAALPPELDAALGSDSGSEGDGEEGSDWAADTDDDEGCACVRGGRDRGAWREPAEVEYQSGRQPPS